MGEFERIILSGPTEMAQIDGFGRTIQTIFLKIKIKGLIDPSETRQFLIEVTVTIKGDIYTYANVFTAESMDGEGNISVGTIYVRGPVEEEAVQYRGAITYIKT